MAEVEPPTAVTAFQDWTGRFLSAASKVDLLPEGLALAKRRRAAFLNLVKSDPQKALALAVPASVRSGLPRELLAELETRIDGIGDLMVHCVEPSPRVGGGAAVRRYVCLNGQTYSAYVYGRRSGQTTKYGIPLHGVALEGQAALSENALEELETGTPLPAEKRLVDLSGLAADQTGPETPLMADAGDRIYRFRSAREWRQAESRLAEGEAGIGPRSAASITELIAGNGPATTEPRSPVSARIQSAWTVGVKRILVIRVDFSDLPGDPRGGGQIYTAAYVQNLMDAEVGPYYLASSYGLTSLSNTVSTQVYRLPQTSAYYAAQPTYIELHNDAETAAAADFAIADYDRVVVLFSRIGILEEKGLAEVGGRRVWVDGECDFWVLAHELGHTYGLFHANLWQVNDQNPISTAGVDFEYGDLFDAMGANYANDHRVDFNPWFKSLIGWIPDQKIQTVTTSGTYRISPFDNASGNGTLALKFVRDGLRNYWIGCRRKFTDNAAMQNGAYVIWGYNSNRQSDLLDLTTPGTNVYDAALEMGTSFTDPGANVTITPVGQGGVAPNQYLDIQIEVPPFVSAAPVDQAVWPGQTATFTVSAVGFPAPIYHWQQLSAGGGGWIDVVDDATLRGSQSATLTVSAIVAMNGDQFRCLVSDQYGVSYSLSAALMVNPPLSVTTLAGSTNNVGSTNGVGAAASFNGPWGLGTDGAGNIYVAETGGQTIRKVTPAGVVSTVAGLGGTSGSADGVGDAARFSTPVGVAVNGAGNIFVTDQGNSTIRRITPGGVVTTVAGLAGSAGRADGMGSAARFSSPTGIAVDGAGNLYVADSGNFTIRKITPAGDVTTLAGMPGTAGNSDGAGTGARFSAPSGIAIDSAGNLYVADATNSTIRKVTPGGVVTTLAGAAYFFGRVDGIGSHARFRSPAGVAVDRAGNIYVADSGDSVMRRVTPSGVVNTIAGLVPGEVDGTGSDVEFSGVVGVAVDSQGTLYISDGNVIRRGMLFGDSYPPIITAAPTNQAVRSGQSAGFSAPAIAGDVSVSYQWQIRPAGSATWTNLVDGGSYRGSQTAQLSLIEATRGMNKDLFQCVVTDAFGSAISAPPATLNVDLFMTVTTLAYVSVSQGIAVDRAGNVYAPDWGYNVVRKISPSGNVSTLAGKDGFGGGADGLGSLARFSGPRGVAADGAGNVYVADTYNNAVREITPGGLVSTVAGGDGLDLGSVDGVGRDARFMAPEGIALDAAGNLYLADTGNHTIRKITTNAVVSTLAGLAGSAGSADGTAANARFNNPIGIAVNGLGAVYVADTLNHTIRVIATNGLVTTLAGIAGSIGSADGPVGSARFYRPSGIAVDASGNVCVADTGNNVIRLITPDGMVSTVAGVAGKTGQAPADGAATVARFSSPIGVAVGADGVVYLADSGRIRKGVLPASLTSPAALVGAPGRLFDGSVRFDVFAMPGETLRIDASSDLLNWRPLATNSSGGGQMQFIDSTAPGAPARFYRAVRP